jgi:hypothetical protein
VCELERGAGPFLLLGWPVQFLDGLHSDPFEPLLFVRPNIPCGQQQQIEIRVGSEYLPGVVHLCTNPSHLYTEKVASK